MLELKNGILAARGPLVRSFNRLPNRVKLEAFYASRLLQDKAWLEAGAFALTNKVFANPDGMWNPTAHKELADQTAAANTDTTIVGLKWGRVRILIKSGMANTNTVVFVVRVGTGTGVTAPEVVATSPTITFVTGDGNLMWDCIFYSQNGYQSFKVTPTNSGGTASYDLMFDGA